MLRPPFRVARNGEGCLTAGPPTVRRSGGIGNRLLAALPTADFDLLARELETVALRSVARNGEGCLTAGPPTVRRSGGIGNRLLAALPTADFDLLARELETVAL